jgi:hypothetical protein
MLLAERYLGWVKSDRKRLNPLTLKVKALVLPATHALKTMTSIGA